MFEVDRKVTEVMIACFLIGGHSVSSALLSHQLGAAIKNALTLGVCVVILSGAAVLAGLIRERATQMAERVKARKPSKKERQA